MVSLKLWSASALEYEDELLQIVHSIGIYEALT
jgi:hypothetical protein